MVACPVCFDLHERVVEWKFATEEWRETPPSYADVSASAEQGCEGCKLIQKTFELTHLDASEYPRGRILINIREQGPTIHILRSGGRDFMRVELFPRNGKEIYHIAWRSYPYSEQKIGAYSMANQGTVSGDTSSNEAFDTARAWLENCVTNHAQCKTSDVLPRRIVDVGEPGTEELPKLIEPCETQHGKYACLSYCWGRDPEANIRTTRDTLAQRKSGIEWKDIPATITDAILACKKLGIRFLWIDALCIIQDDVQDWALECANMAEIYSNSYITLAAVIAQDPLRGMFKRLPDRYGNIDFDVWIAGTNEIAQISAREALNHRSETDPLRSSDSVIRPLKMRAWVLQEMLLSPRILRFNMHELSWECREIMTSECSRIARKSATSLIHQVSSNERSISDEEYFYGWRNIISSFSGRNIFRERDRLPAISAVARKFSPVGGRYFAGIWEKDFFRGLLWTSEDSDMAKTLDKSAPSWSWTSSPTQVTFACDNLAGEEKEQFVFQEHATIRDIRCIPVTVNNFGSVQGGSITLSGRFVQVLVTRIERNRTSRPASFVYVSLPRPLQDIDTCHERTIIGHGLRDDKILSDPSAEMYALLLASNPKPVRYKPVHFSLLLRKIPNDEYSVAYERLGLLEEYCPYDELSAQLNSSFFAGTTEETITIV